jgi:hypothetical protein
MAWQWSHTAEAYADAYANVMALPRADLEVIFAEIKAAKPREYGEPDFVKARYAKALREARKLPDDILADAVWSFAEEHRTCTNGGHRAHVCPWGCHTVAFDRPRAAD